MNNEVEVVVKSADKTDFAKTRTEAKKAGDQVGNELKRGFKEAEQAAASSTAQIGKSLEQTKGKASGIAESLGGMIEGSAKGGIAAAGLTLGTVLLEGISSMMETRKIAGILAAQVGATSEQAGHLGHVAGEVFADNFGDSIADVADAMKAVLQNKLVDSGAAEADIKHLTELAMTASQVVGDEVNNIARAAQQMLVNGLAASAEQAMDIIVRASQEGLNVNGDLLDSITEYGTKFRDLGLTGQEALGLISQAMEGGARDTDFAADALKEFAIKAIDGTATTIRGFEAIGLTAADMGAAIAQGGNSAKAALGETLDHLRAIHDPVTRDAAAVDLFGTKAEDLGDSLYKMDLDEAAKKFGNFAGATEKAADGIAQSTPPLETAWRNIKGMAGDAAEFVAGTPDKIKAGMQEYAKQQAEATNATRQHEIAVQEAADAYKNEASSIKHVTVTLDNFIDKQHEAQTGVIDLSRAQIHYQEAIDDAAKSAKENKKNLDLNTEAGRENRNALNDLADSAYRQVEAMRQQGSTAQDVAGFMEGARGTFIQLAQQMGLSKQEAERLADQLRLIPSDIKSRYALEGTAQAMSAIQTIRGHLVDLTNRQWIASVAVTGKGAGGGGRYFAGLEHGGVAGASHAAEGGPRGNWTLVGEHGPEMVDLAPGSMVHSNPDTERILGQAGGGWAPTALEARVLGDLDGHFASWLHKMQRDGLLQFVVK